MSKDQDIDTKGPKVGDRIWMTSAEPSNELEQALASLLSKQFDPQQLVRLVIHPLGPRALSSGTYHDRTVVRFGRSLMGVLHFDHEVKATVPRTRLSRKGTQQSIHQMEFFQETLTICDQYLLVLAKAVLQAGTEAADHMHFQAGLASLLFGQEMSRRAYFDNYFSLKDAKFTVSDFRIESSSPNETPFVRFDELPEEPFGEFSDTEVRALQFCYRAHRSTDQNIRIVLYYAALEILFSDRKFGNKLRQFYSFSEDLVAASDEAVNSLRAKRKEAIHRGLSKNFDGYSERVVQAIILDVLFRESWGTYETSILRHVISDREQLEG